MGKVSGVVLILGGLAAAVYALPTGSQMGEPDFGRFTELPRTGLPASAGAQQVLVVPEPKPAVRPPRVAAEPVPPFSAPVVVTIAQRPNESAPPKSAAMPRDRDGIGRELQRELKRVGCYEGELNGVWTAPTRQAMKAFTERVNASLPTDEPDSILLTMVRGYQDRVCGKPCPAGQGLSEGGRCVPNAILVRAPAKPSVAAAAQPTERKASEPAITSWTTTTSVAAPQPVGVAPTEGRMALAGPAATAEPQPPGAPAPGTDKAATRRPAERAKSQSGWARGMFKNEGSLN